MPIHIEDQLITGNDAAVFATGTNTAELRPPCFISTLSAFAFLQSSEDVYFCVIGELLWLFVLVVGISQSTTEQSCSTLFVAGRLNQLYVQLL